MLLLPPRILLALICAAQTNAIASPGDAPDFQRDVRPILADRCFRCHGPDAGARKRGLRLDTQEGSRAELKSGERAIVPHDVDTSAAAQRITSEDDDEVMPPPSLNKPLSDVQKRTLLEWIEAGAEYEVHWAFVAPKPSPPPAVKDAKWARDPLDAFVLAKLETAGLAPAPEAERATLLRRAALALTGLPPTPEETAAFVADPALNAFEREVERLLASPRCAEHLAADWLDVARFADTYGYQSDADCNTWPWRDWLIGAFQRNLPYDEFVRQQLAGDLMPGATRDSRLATAFNRLHRMTNEGGSIDEEFRQEGIADRVATYGTAFLGLTVECARCHDHKYDPIPQQDYYSLGAFFGAIDEAGTYSYSFHSTPRPALRLPTRAQEEQLAQRDAALAAAEAACTAVLAERREAAAAWSRSATDVSVLAPVRNYPLDGAIEGPTGLATPLDGDSGPAFTDVPPFRRCDPFSLVFWMRCPDRKARATVVHTSTFTIESDQQGYQLMLLDGRLAWQLIHLWPGSAAAIETRAEFPLQRWVQVAVTSDGSSRAAGLRIFLDGVPVETDVVRDHLDGPATVRTFQIGFRDRDVGFAGGAVDDVRVFDRALTALEVAELYRPGALAEALARATNGGAAVEDELEELFVSTDPACRSAAQALRDERAAQQDVLESVREVAVMEATRHARASYVLERGAYDQPDMKRPVRTDRALEEVLAFDPAWPKDRAGLAAWTTDARNPLVARVAVNRLWALCFGSGLVATQENFGQQGEPPSHPELLDTLAADFVASGWDVRALLARIVSSATFRQSSDATPAKLERDPDNRMFSRGPSFRLSAETLRDQALAASGLLVEQVGGPSAKPWQPPGLWEEAGATGAYVPDSGDGAHRRSLYTFRKRTSPPPDMLLFDAGSREKCLARRQPTNTPLQALVLLNDPVFLECACALAQRAAREAGEDPVARIRRAFRLLAAREPRDEELAALRALHDAELEGYARDPEAARAVNAWALAVPQPAIPAASDASPGSAPPASPVSAEAASPDASLAALTLVCSTLLASDAVVTSR